MTKPLRQWNVKCPYCDQHQIYPELTEDKGCQQRKCAQCGTIFVCSSYKYNCETCQTQEQCFDYPTVIPIIHRSSWRAVINALNSGFKELAWRDLVCVTYVRGETHSEAKSSEDGRLRLAQHNLLVTTFEVDKETLVIWNPQPEPAVAPFQVHLGFFGRRG
jgi:hypothetical protein